jgi:hypothetical protein
MEEVNLVNQVRKTPLLLTGIFLELCRMYYSTLDNLPVGVNYSWIPEDQLNPQGVKVAGKAGKGTKCSERVAAMTSPTAPKQGAAIGKYIFIDQDYNDLSSLIQQRPAIIVQIGDITYSNVMGLDGRNPEIGMNLEEGETQYSRRGAGQVSFRHIGRSSGEARLIAAATLDFFDAFSPVIKKDYCFETFAPTTVSKVRYFEEASERYECVVTCSFSFQDTWTLKSESPKLRAVELRIRELSGREA